MHFDGDGCLRHFHDDIIHSFNKNANALAASPFWKKHALDARPCVLLLGDSLGDPVWPKKSQSYELVHFLHVKEYDLINHNNHLSEKWYF
jgi:hypothetical protein